LRISVVIPVKNGAATLVKCLDAIKKQTIADQLEIVVLDSMSTDNSREIAKSFGAKIFDIPNGTFNHGLTRNLGTQHTNGELVYFTVQDAYLAEENQLEKMAAHFSDTELQAVVGMQAVPNHSDKNPAKWFKRMTQPVTSYQHFPNGTFSRLSLKKQLSAIDRWDDVNAMYRRSALTAIPFIETSFAEDKIWARDALQAGYKIAFNPSLVVYHYHHYNFAYAFKVSYIVNYAYYTYWHVLPLFPSFVTPALTAGYRIWKNRTLAFKKKIYWSFHNLSGITGSFLSHLTFLAVGKFFGDKTLDKSFKLFCKEVPQGKIKERN
jgi:rhamnosyltransferase